MSSPTREAVSDAVTGEVAVFLEVAGRAWPCRKSLPMWRLMKLARDMQDGDQMKNIAGMYDFTMAIVLPGHRQDMDEYLSEVDMDPKEFSEAIGNVMQALAGRPKDSGTASASSSSPNSITPSSRVVSLQPVTDLPMPPADLGMFND